MFLTISILMNIGFNVVIHWKMLQTFLEPRLIISSGKVPKGGIAGTHLYNLIRKKTSLFFHSSLALVIVPPFKLNTKCFIFDLQLTFIGESSIFSCVWCVHL